MDPTARATDRWLPFVGVALLVEAALGFLPHVRQADSGALPQIVNAVCSAMAGGATLIAARRRSATEIRAFLWITFIALGGLHLAAYAASGKLESYMLTSHFIFGNASWSLIGCGAPILWGTALARLEDPGNPSLQKLGRIAAGLVQLGFVFLFASEVGMWGRFGSSAFGSGAAAYGASQALQVADRVLLLWCSIDSVRTAVDDDMTRRRASRIHRLMSWWVLLSLLANIFSQIVMQMQTGSPNSIQSYLHTFVRMLIYQTIVIAATLAVALHFQTKRTGYKSDAPANPWTGAEA
jgi:hypothetical protein